MNGAEALTRTLLANGVDTCFANPGTSEMHFVAALDRVGGMRCILGLAETVVTGAADGYARMAGRPAMSMLHLGIGLANGMSNIHNARKARSPMLVIVGDQATYHRDSHSPGASDVVAMAKTVSDWVRSSDSAADVGRDAADAVHAARTPPGRVATLVLPGDTSWNEGAQPSAALAVQAPVRVPAERIRAIARVLRDPQPRVLLLSGAALHEKGLAAAQRVAHATGARCIAAGPVPRMARGRGRAAIDRVPYPLDKAMAMLAGTKHLVLVGALPPTPVFAYPGKPTVSSPADCTTHILSQPDEDASAALADLADELGVPATAPAARPGAAPRIAKGPFEPDAFAATLAAVLPEHAIVADDAVTSGRTLFPFTFEAAPHDWLQITGGAIGHALPCATGAAVACPERKVVALEGDGAGMYTLQSLWTQAREGLDVVNVIFANRTYRILQGELTAVGAQPGEASKRLFDIGNPDLDWVKLAGGMGVEARVVDTLEGFADVFRAASKRRGPFLIEMRI